MRRDSLSSSVSLPNPRLAWLCGAVCALGLALLPFSCGGKEARAERDRFINNPFPFTILKNYSDDYSTIGTVLESRSICPLAKENIADPAFCMIRELAYDGLVVRVFSFDVLQSGTAEYLVTSPSVSLTNGLRVGSSRGDALSRMGTPYKETDDLLVWRSSDAHNYVAFTFNEGLVSRIRWHEERVPTYKGVIVWETRY